MGTRHTAAMMAPRPLRPLHLAPPGHNRTALPRANLPAQGAATSAILKFRADGNVRRRHTGVGNGRGWVSAARGALNQAFAVPTVNTEALIGVSPDSGSVVERPNVTRAFRSDRLQGEVTHHG